MPISVGSKRLAFVVVVDDFLVEDFVDDVVVVVDVFVSTVVVVDGISELVVVTAVVADEDVVELLDSVLEFAVGTDSEPGLTRQSTTIVTVINAATTASIAFFIGSPPVAFLMILKDLPVSTLLQWKAAAAFPGAETLKYGFAVLFC